VQQITHFLADREGRGDLLRGKFDVWSSHLVIAGRVPTDCETVHCPLADATGAWAARAAVRFRLLMQAYHNLRRVISVDAENQL
jgi:hypothetical protein